MSTLRALWRLNQKSYVQFDQIEKDVPIYALQFVIHAYFLSVQLLRLYEFFKK